MSIDYAVIRKTAWLTSGFIQHSDRRKDGQESKGSRMRHTDIVIAGGGLAGSTAAAMLARAGFGVRSGRSSHRSIRRTFGARSSTGRRLTFCGARASPRRCSRPAPSTGNCGSRASGDWSKSCPATSTASSTTRWSTPFAGSFRRARNSSAPRSRRSRTDRTARSSRSRPANGSRRVWWWCEWARTSGFGTRSG